MENNIEIKRIGKTTFGITFILVGIALILQIFIKQDIFKYVMLMWPIVLILFGIEVLYYSHKKDVSIKYDTLGIFLSFLIIIFGSIFSIVNLGMIKITESEFLFNKPLEYNYTRYFNVEEIELKVINLSDNNVEVIIKEDKNLDMTRVDFKINAKEEKIDNIKELFNDYSFYEFVSINDYDDNKIEIYEYSSWVKDMKITIYTPNKDLIKCTGDVDLKN